MTATIDEDEFNKYLKKPLVKVSLYSCSFFFVLVHPFQLILTTKLLLLFNLISTIPLTAAELLIALIFNLISNNSVQ